MLQRDFYLRDARTVARDLLGKVLFHKTTDGTTSGMIVEAEAYDGACDKGAHSYKNKRTPRTEIQFGLGGYAYVYSIYGMHCCFNVVTGGIDEPQVVLVRALMPIDGITHMRERRNGCDVKNLCNGPGKLCAALDIQKREYGLDLCGESLYIADCKSFSASEIEASPRVNIDYAQECRDFPWRYYVKDCEFVSKVSKKYAGVPLRE